jgi:hypothetical protein
MNERDWANRFGRDVDNLLNGIRQTDSEPLPAEYRHALDLARTLAQTDFSPESQMRPVLRRRLLNQVGAREGQHPRKEYTMHTLRTFFWPRRFAMLAAIVLTILLAVTLAWPGALTAAAQGIYHVIQRIVVGPNTEIMQIELQDEPRQPQPLPSDTWTVVTEIGAFGGDAPPGVEPTVRSVADFEEAQELTSFHLRAPGYLPEGYILREIRLAPGHAFSFYTGPGHDIIFVQASVGPQASSDPNVAVGVKSSFVTNGTLEEVALNGRPAAWTDNHSLMWEADNISYTVGGLDLSLDEAIRIAESLR